MILLELDRKTVFLSVNMLLILACIFLMFRLYIDGKNYTGKNNIYISPYYNDNKYYFSKNELLSAKDRLGNMNISYELKERAFIRNNNYEIYGDMIYIEPEYFNINSFKFIRGSAFPKSLSDNKIIILSESIAYYLFGSYDILGKTVTIESQPYEITGIIGYEEFDKDIKFAYIPYSKENNQKEISNVYINIPGYNELSAQISGEKLLADLNKNTMDYRITDLNRYLNNIYLRPLGVASVFLLLMLYFYIGKAVKSFKGNKKNIALYIVASLILILFISFCHRKIVQDLWITTESLSLKSVISILTNENKFPTVEYLPYQLTRLYEINKYSNYCFAISFFLMIILISMNWVVGRSGWDKNKKRNKSIQ